MRQTQLVYFLAYKLMLIAYLGCLLIYYDLDIFAFILWIVYGAFIAMIFIFSLLWVDTTYFKYDTAIYRRFLWSFPFVSFALFFMLTGLSSGDAAYYMSFFEVGWINYYELMLWDLEEEIEVLGWLLGFENVLALIWVSYLLSLACFCIVSIILSARRVRFMLLDNELALQRSQSILNFKIQNFVLQEAGSIGAPKNIFELFHRRRI